jgi:hypothetical protein
MLATIVNLNNNYSIIQNVHSSKLIYSHLWLNGDVKVWSINNWLFRNFASGYASEK